MTSIGVVFIQERDVSIFFPIKSCAAAAAATAKKQRVFSHMPSAHLSAACVCTCV